MSTRAPHHPLHRTHALHPDAPSAARGDPLEREQAPTVAKRRGALHRVGRLVLAAPFLSSAGARLLGFNATRRATDAFGLAGSVGLNRAFAPTHVTVAGGLRLPVADARREV